MTTHSAGSVTCTQEIPLEVGDVVHQDNFVGDVRAVFDAFSALWSPMWNKHMDTPAEHWEPLMQQIASQVPRPSQAFVLQPISCEQWLAAAKRRPVSSATGPDGVSRNDLLLMPPNLVRKLVAEITAVENGQRRWPQACLVGLITSIEKTDNACHPGQFRPITVLSQVYRNWSSIRSRQILKWMDEFCPSTQTGNRPSMTTKHLWWRLSQTIEASHATGSPIAGIVTDIVKCFNTLPRPIVAFAARHLGLPLPLVACWHQAVNMVERRFVVDGCCGDPIYSTTGYPEGDGLSVVAMSILNYVTHSMMALSTPGVEVHSYVDNWELVTSQPDQLPGAFEALHSMATDFGISLDRAKTYAWAVRSSDRATLRKHFSVRFGARDLGGHVSYCRRKTMHTLSARIASHADSWTWLARSTAPVSQKLQLLGSVMWPRMLHGVSGLWISDSHCKKLRAAAMQSLGWKRKGASSVVQIGLCADPRADPGFHCVVTTILDFRRYCQPEIAFPVVTQMAHLGIAARYTPGPCGAFLHRLHELNWHWESDGFIRDHDSRLLHILDSPRQLLTVRIREAWGFVIGGIVATRRTYEGLQHVDVPVSHELSRELDPTHAGLLRTAMNGTFFTRDAQVHSGLAPDKTCPFCDHEDGLKHRHWECTKFNDLRTQLPAPVRAMLPHLPECAVQRGWMTVSPWKVPFSRALDLLPDTTQDFAPCPSFSVLRLFSDGSCLSPTDAQLRVATWGVCLADVEADTFLPVSSGAVTGGLHSTL